LIQTEGKLGFLLEGGKDIKNRHNIMVLPVSRRRERCRNSCCWCRCFFCCNSSLQLLQFFRHSPAWLFGVDIVIVSFSSFWTIFFPRALREKKLKECQIMR